MNRARIILITWEYLDRPTKNTTTAMECEEARQLLRRHGEFVRR